MTVFGSQARGSESASFASRLASECHAHWADGRQMCEMVSLTGRGCSVRKHRVAGQPQETGILTCDL